MTRLAWQFVGLTYALSWMMAFAFFGFGGRWNTPWAFALATGYMFMPATATVLLQKLIRRRPLSEVGLVWKPNRWWVIGWAAPVGLALLALGAALLIPGVEFTPGMEGMFERFGKTLTPEQVAKVREQMQAMPLHPFWLGLVQALVAGATVNAVAGLGEELGWRGLLQRELEPLGFWRSSWVVGLVWGLWHAPLILQGHNYPEHPVAGVAMMCAMTVLIAPLFAYVRTRAGSVIAAALFHGTFNAAGNASILVLRGGSDLLVGMTGIAGLAAIALLDLALWVHLRGRSARARA